MKIVRIVLILIVVCVLGFCGFICWRYFSWKSTFNTEKNTMICSSGTIDTNPEIDTAIQKKIKDYVFSDDTNYMTLTLDEIMYFLLTNIESSDSFSLDEICISADNSVWRVYINAKIQTLNLPWFSFNIIKDNRETAELYVDDLTVGDLPIPFGWSDNLVDYINHGISDALVTVSENEFLGRNIINIELLDDSVVIKGEKV